MKTSELNIFKIEIQKRYILINRLATVTFCMWGAKFPTTSNKHSNSETYEQKHLFVCVFWTKLKVNKSPSFEFKNWNTNQNSNITIKKPLNPILKLSLFWKPAKNY